MKNKKYFLSLVILIVFGFFIFRNSINVKDSDNIIKLDKNFQNKEEKKWKSNEDFNIETLKSSVDYNENGIDDYRDILEGARQDAVNHPEYDPAYVQGGYPADDKGVCTDVVWRAFKKAGYNLKDMVDRDIAKNIGDYPRVGGKPDKNIDFRRVPNLDVFFSKYGESLTLDPDEIEKWQPGDIVVYGTKHIGIVSDRRNSSGRSYLIHNYGQREREEDNLLWGTITGHYRFNAENIPNSILIKLENWRINSISCNMAWHNYRIIR